MFESAMYIFTSDIISIRACGKAVHVWCYFLLSQVIIETAVGEESWPTLSNEN